MIGVDVRDGERFGLRQGEEGITDRVLLDLCRKIPGLKITKFTHKREAANGADWEWWIPTTTGRWFAFRMQAKKLLSSSSGRGKYDFSYKVESAGKTQLESLIDTAHIDGIPAVYALYNQAGSSRYSAHRHLHGCPTPTAGQGVTVISAKAVAKVFGPHPAAVEDVQWLSLPWSCLAHCPGVHTAVQYDAMLRDMAGSLGLQGTGSADAELGLSLARQVWMLMLLGSETPPDAPLDWAYQYMDVTGVFRELPDYVPANGTNFELDSGRHPLAELGMAPRYVAAFSPE